MKLFHGTTADNAARILRGGFSTETGGENWSVSGEAVYFWSPEAMVEAGEDEDGIEYMVRDRARDSGSIGLGFAKDARIVVFEVELDEAFDVQPDESCENMDGAVCVFDNVPASAIRKIWITDDLSLIKGYYLSFCVDRPLCSRELTKMEKKVAKAFEKAELYPDDEGMTELTEISIEKAMVELNER